MLDKDALGIRAGQRLDVADIDAPVAGLVDPQPLQRGQRDAEIRGPTRIVGVLDWELATVGDPLMDLGSALAYWVQADDDPAFLAVRLQPTHTPGMLTRAEVVQRYCAARSLDVTPQEWLFYDVFGLFRLAGIAQQIYYRYHHGQTSNPAYARFGEFVRILDARCSALLAGQP